MLARPMRVFKKDHLVTATVQHQFGNLSITPERAALVAGHPRPPGGPAARAGQLSLSRLSVVPVATRSEKRDKL